MLAHEVLHAGIAEILADLVHGVLDTLDFVEVVDLLVAHLRGQSILGGASVARNLGEGVRASRLGRCRLDACMPLLAQDRHAQLIVANVANNIASLVAELAEDLRHLLVVSEGLPELSGFWGNRRDVRLSSVAFLEAVFVLEGDGVLRLVGIERCSVDALIHQLRKILLHALCAGDLVG